ncbi:MAG TPA: hypothetical protein VM347_28380, partial [Nonomuraea sp.]|nr:hypothetical protein [Nonomuraea sp.]
PGGLDDQQVAAGHPGRHVAGGPDHELVAGQLGQPLAIPQDDIDRLYGRYQNVYGQRSPR